jgi:starch-binding outer membrane protein SusE/F
MKKYFDRVSSSVLILLFFAACQKTETNITYNGGTPPPVLSSNVPANDTIALSPVDSSNTALVLSWTNPNYAFSNGISSLNVNYNLQIDTAGSNFSNPLDIVEAIASDLGTNVTVGQLNAFLGNTLLLATGVPHTIQVRIESFLNENSLPLYSNAITYIATPYAPPPKVAPPSSYADNPNGTLFIVGSATVGGWNNPMSVNPATQQFTEVSPTDYTITIALVGGEEYKLIGVNGSWGDQWSVATTDAYPNGGPFVFNGQNCLAPSASGTYTLNFNFQLGTFTVTPN